MRIPFPASASWFIGRHANTVKHFFCEKTRVPRKDAPLIDGPPSSSAEVQNERLAESHHEGQEDHEGGFRRPFEFNNTMLKDGIKPFVL